MCRTWAIEHTCHHTAIFRLSTCTGSFTHTNRKTYTPSPLCRATPPFALKSELPCGPCSKAAEEQNLEAELAQLRSDLIDQGDFWLDDAQRGYEAELWKLGAKFPDWRFKKTTRPGRGEFSTARVRVGSTLREEVKVEDLPPAEEEPAAAVGNSWDWGEGWATLDEEIAQAEREREEAGLPALSTDFWEEHGWGETESDESEPAESEPLDLNSHVGEDLDIVFVDVDMDPEEDLFTFPGERFSAVTAPVQDGSSPSSMPYYQIKASSRSENTNNRAPHERSRSMSGIRDKTMQTSNDLTSLRGCGMWSMEFVAAN